MNISFELKSPQEKVSPVRIVITHKAKRYRKATGVSVISKNFKKGRCGDPVKDAELKRIRIKLDKLLNDFSSDEEIKTALRFTFDDKKEELTDLAKHEVGRPTFWEYFENWSNKECTIKRQKQLYYRVIKRLMGTKEDWEGIDSAYYFKLRQKMEDEEFSINYQGTILSKLRAVMSEGYKQKFHKNDEFREFHKIQEETFAVYVTQEELERLWNLKLTNKTLERTRDLFIIGVYTAARFQDYSRLSTENFIDGNLVYIQHKTNERVVLPLSGRLQAVIERNGGMAPKINQVVFNRDIKKVCELAGMTETIQLSRSKGANHINLTKKKYELVSSHTARRTGATLLYLNGVSMRQCMFITGHKSESSFMKYIRITREENAKALASNPFFNN